MVERPNRKRPTQVDVARRAGVSQTTVSQILNGNEAADIPEPTQKRVFEAIAALGYLPNRVARSLRTQKTYTIACIIPDITNPFYPALERGVQQVSDQEGYDVIVYNTDGKQKKEQQIISALGEGRVDGVIGVFFHTGADTLIKLISSGVAVVRIEARARKVGVQPLDNLYLDNVAAAEAATNYLCDSGYQRVAMIGAPNGPQSERLEGYQRALLARGREPYVIEADDFSEQGGQHVMADLLEATSRPDAVFAANDLIAVGALLEAHRLGFSVPQDVAVMGFDDIHLARLMTPALSTVRQPQEKIGKRAAELLFDRLKRGVKEPGRSEEITFEVVVRAST